MRNHVDATHREFTLDITVEMLAPVVMTIFRITPRFQPAA